MNLSTYLIRRLEELGLEHALGVPGDYVMPFMDVLLESKIKLVCTCNELNAGYAADGYARIRGLSALVVTYGVGGFSCFNAVSGAYAEHVPMVVICGGVPLQETRAGLVMHHRTTADYQLQRKIYGEITAASAVLDDPASAPQQIDRVLSECLRHKLPVYLEIPLDLTLAPCAPPTTRLQAAPHPSESGMLEAAVLKASALLDGAARPAVLVGSEIERFDLCARVQELLERVHYPCAVSIDAVTTMPTRPGHRGLYWGQDGDAEALDMVTQADALLCLGATRNDITSKGFSEVMTRNGLICAHPDRVEIAGERFEEVRLGDLIQALLERLQPRQELAASPPTRSQRFEPAGSQQLTSDRLFAALQGFLTADMVVVSDTGDAFFQSARLKGLGRYLVQSFYLSIGFALPAGLGASLASPGQRVVILIGDGAFQMTAQELSTILRLRLPVTVILINNDGYVIERMLHHDAPYNEIQRWNYAALPAVFGDCLSLRVVSEQDLADALNQAGAASGPVFLEIVLERNDCAQSLRNIGKIEVAAG